MTGKEALLEIKEYRLVTYDDEGNEEDCYKFGELEPNLIEAIEEDLKALEQIKKALVIKQKMPDFKISEDFSLEEMLNNTLIEYAYMLEEKARKKFTEWILDNIDFEIIKGWLKDGKTN